MDFKCEKAFQHLKRSLTEAPVLFYADPSKPYELHVDASRDGLGESCIRNRKEGYTLQPM